MYRSWWSRRVAASAPTTSSRGCFRDRIIFVGTAIDDIVANLVIAQLLFLEAEDPDRDINLYIHSPGGIVSAGLAIYDTMEFIRPDVATICMGQAASMGALLLAAGAKGKRSALPHARIMIHQPMGGSRGQAFEIYIYTKEIVTLREKMNEILALHTGQPVERIRQGHRPQLLHVGGGGEGVRDRRRGDRQEDVDGSRRDGRTEDDEYACREAGNRRSDAGIADGPALDPEQESP